MSDLTHEEWIQSKAYHLLDQMPGYTTEWVPEREMTVDEKENHPNYATVGGYLKEIDNFQKRQEWWNSLSDDEKSTIKSIPNFDVDIFYECTGIKIEQ